MGRKSKESLCKIVRTFSSEKKNKECQVLTKIGIKYTELCYTMINKNILKKTKKKKGGKENSPRPIIIILEALNGAFHPMEVLKINSSIKQGVQN
jgi:tRNA U54 and U55 pseudouridine synthase Pus10